MKITVFTSNQPRHLSLIESLARIADKVYAIQECNTLFPGEVADFFKKSEVMQEYFSRVIEAEAAVFGRPRFSPENVVHLPMKMGDLNQLEFSALSPALESDLYVVFGASYIKGELCEHLVSNHTYNIHMGVSPHYRGSSTNFWAMYDKHPEYVGATIHVLTKGLDSGPIVCHAFPVLEAVDPFIYGMKAVKAGHDALIQLISSGKLLDIKPVEQDRSLEIRYTRNSDFTDEVAREYLERLPSAEEMETALSHRVYSDFVNIMVL